jgi:hypothetical protein
VKGVSARSSATPSHSTSPSPLSTRFPPRLVVASGCSPSLISTADSAGAPSLAYNRFVALRCGLVLLIVRVEKRVEFDEQVVAGGRGASRLSREEEGRADDAVLMCYRTCRRLSSSNAPPFILLQLSVLQTLWSLLRPFSRRSLLSRDILLLSGFTAAPFTSDMADRAIRARLDCRQQLHCMRFARQLTRTRHLFRRDVDSRQCLLTAEDEGYKGECYAINERLRGARGVSSIDISAMGRDARRWLLSVYCFRNGTPTAEARTATPIYHSNTPAREARIATPTELLPSKLLMLEAGEVEVDASEDEPATAVPPLPSSANPTAGVLSKRKAE